MAPQLHELYLMVSDLDRSVRFYRETVGLQLADRGQRSATFETGACPLKVEADFDAETLAEFGLRPPGERRGDGAVFALEVEDVHERYDQATTTGAETLIEPQEVPWGREMFLLEDPDGYVIELFEPSES